MSKLYEIAQEFREVMALVESGDLSMEDIADTLDAIDIEFKDKAKNCLMVIRAKEADLNGVQAEIDRLTALKKSAQASCDGLKKYVKNCMELTGISSLDLSTFKLTLKAPTKKVEVYDEAKLAREFFRVVPEKWEVDKVKLSAALKVGEIEGAMLVDGERALLIK